MDRDDLVRCDAEVVREGRHRSTGGVHVGDRFGEDHPSAWRTAREQPDAGLRDGRPRAPRRAERERRPGAPAQLVEHHLADVVPVARVLRPRVAEPDDEPGLVAHVTSSQGVGAQAPQATQTPQRPAPDGTGRRGCRRAADGSVSRDQTAASSSVGSASPCGTAIVTTTAVGSSPSTAPFGSTTSPAWICTPASRPSIETSM
ncbi:hypothetical protein GALL_356870 [mine drainage metagenome]|uniref:Uncharacterized protein n=1 Tax=mine drainage metagenome TaxID=410659 RepID=A0A1J5QG50_9ZZZZ